MSPETKGTIAELNETLREALRSGQFEMAARIEKKINQLIEYGTKIPA